MEQTRRDFLWTGASGLGAAWIAAQLPAIEAAAAHASEALAHGQSFEALTAEEARELEAIAARILPSDETPGAVEAGVIHFIDRAFVTFQAGALPSVRAGLAELSARAAAVDPAASAFSDLADTRQDELLREIESGNLFGTIRFLTIAGMFSMPAWGGNRGEAGWRLLGFESRPVWQPPFGHYDAEAADG